jgi:hypothetical protein
MSPWRKSYLLCAPRIISRSEVAVLIAQKRFGSWTALEGGILPWKAMNFPGLGKRRRDPKAEPQDGSASWRALETWQKRKRPPVNRAT